MDGKQALENIKNYHTWEEWGCECGCSSDVYPIIDGYEDEIAVIDFELSKLEKIRGALKDALDLTSDKSKLIYIQHIIDMEYEFTD